MVKAVLFLPMVWGAMSLLKMPDLPGPFACLQLSVLLPLRIREAGTVSRAFPAVPDQEAAQA